MNKRLIYLRLLMAAMDLRSVREGLSSDSLTKDGGEGSGHFNHAGIPGEVGGSAPSGTTASTGGGTKRDMSKALGQGAAIQAKYGGEANHKGLGNGSGAPRPRFKYGMGKTVVSWADIERTGGNHSALKYKMPNGNLTDARERLHDSMIIKSFRGVAKAEGQPTFYMMGGGPAAGKSTLIEDGWVEVPDEFNAIHINPDEFKYELPEYQEMVKKKDKSAAWFTHEESSAVAKRVNQLAIDNGYNTLLDGTGDNSAESVKMKIKAARAVGMRVEAYYVTCPTEDAVKRNQTRYLDTSRYVVDDVVRDTHRGVSQILPQVAHLFDKVQLYDTTVRGKPVLIAEGGGGKPLKVLDKGLYDKFIAKGREKYPHDEDYPYDAD